MKITRVETIPVDVPIRPEFQIRGSLGSHTESPFLMLRVHTDEGLIGLGEVSCTPSWSGEDQVTAAHFIAGFLAPAVMGEDPRDIERLTAKMRRAVAANPFTKSAMEMALWDILGKSAGLPVYRLLGGKVRETVPIKMSVSGAEPKRAAQLAEWAMEQGLKALKVKVGIEPEGDVARVKAVRAAIGAGCSHGRRCQWRLESARGHSDDPTAGGGVRHLFRRAAGGAARRAMDGRCAAQRAGAGDGRRELLHAAGRHGAGRAPARRTSCRSMSARAAGSARRARSRRSPKRRDSPARWAAIWSWVSPARRWRIWRRPPRASARRNFPATSWDRWLTRTTCSPNRRVRDGAVRAPDKPGLGVELDEAKLARYRVRLSDREVPLFGCRLR